MRHRVRDERVDRYRRFLAAWAELRENQLFQNLVILLNRAADSAQSAATAEVTV